MPSVIPVKRTALAAQGAVTDWKLRHDFTAVARGVVIPTPEDHDPSAFGGFAVDGVTRAWANHLNHPDAVIGGWQAADIHGLGPDWGDSAPVLLLAGHRRNGSLISTSAAKTPLRPVFRPSPSGIGDMHTVSSFSTDESGDTAGGSRPVFVDHPQRSPQLVGP